MCGALLYPAPNFFGDGITRLNAHSIIRSVLRPDAPLFGAWRRNRRRPGECRAELTKYAAARPLFALRAGGNDFWGNPQEGVAVFPSEGTLRIIFVRTQTPSIVQTAPSVVIQSPSFPSGFPPPRGIGDSPRIMRDKRGRTTLAYHGALTKFDRRALPAEIPAWGEEFGLAHDARVYLELR